MADAADESNTLELSGDEILDDLGDFEMVSLDNNEEANGYS